MPTHSTLARTDRPAGQRQLFRNLKSEIRPRPPKKQPRPRRVLRRGLSVFKTFGGLRRVESLGEWRVSGVLLHLPFGEAGHPGKVGPAVGMSAEGCFAVACQLPPASSVKHEAVSISDSLAHQLIGFLRVSGEFPPRLPARRDGNDTHCPKSSQAGKPSACNSWTSNSALPAFRSHDAPACPPAGRWRC
jgi:hypothetical protein